MARIRSSSAISNRKERTGKPAANPFLSLKFFSGLRIHSFILL